MRTANKDFVTTEVEQMWDAADVMRMGKDPVSYTHLVFHVKHLFAQTADSREARKRQTGTHRHQTGERFARSGRREVRGRRTGAKVGNRSNRCLLYTSSRATRKR